MFNFPINGFQHLIQLHC